MVLLDAAGAPQVVGLGVGGGVLVARKDGEGQAVRIDAQPLRAGQELPGPGDGFLLEVVAERPVAQHLKEGQVRGVADLVDVAGADALLHVGKPRALRVLGAQQIRDQRVHAGGGEQHRRVVFRDDGGRGDDRVSPLLEEAQEHRAQLCGGDVLHTKTLLFMGFVEQKSPRPKASWDEGEASAVPPKLARAPNSFFPCIGGNPPALACGCSEAARPAAFPARFHRARALF